jgi:hypothetical protein
VSTLFFLAFFSRQKAAKGGESKFKRLRKCRNLGQTNLPSWRPAAPFILSAAY